MMTHSPIKNRIQGALNLHRAWRLVWSAAPRWSFYNALLILLQSVLPLLALYCLKQIVDHLTIALSTDISSSFTPVVLWIGLAGLVALCSTLLTAISSYVTEAQSLVVTDHVNDVIHEKSIAVDLGYYEDPAFHNTLHLAQQDAPARPANIVNGIQQTVMNLLVLIGIIALLFTFHWFVGLALLLAALPAGVVRLVTARQLFGFEQERAELERQAWYYHWMLTSIDFARDIRLLGIGALFSARFSALRDQLREGRLEIGARRVRRDMLAQGGAVVVLYGTLAAMAYLAVMGSMTLGVVVMYFQGYQRALSALQNVLQGLAWLYEDNLFLKHYHDFLSLPVQVENEEGSESVPGPSEEGLACRGIRFTYPSRSEETLKGVDLFIRPGEVVALVGVNGAGKSTLAKLLCRLYDLDEGVITWEGEDLCSFRPSAWRKQVSVVSQDFSRFDLSIAENIWLGDVEREMNDVELRMAAEQSGSARVIDQFPGAMKTVLGTQFRDGQELSTGEWQRLALARAWFRDAQLLILDEPTSALDPLAEANLVESFKQVIGRKSALIISHRFSTVCLADRIYVLDQGLIVEQGTHNELLMQMGRYSELYTAQADVYTE